ncbi:MAG: hypothetical protein WC310_02320 [Patescibacteria group bacterium]|jgi:hypothetical protein
MYLDRKETERVWNALQEIRSFFVSEKNKIKIPLLGGWVANKYNKGIKGVELTELIKGRIWAFQILQKKGVIKNIKYPLEEDINGYFEFSTNEQKFKNEFKNFKKSYKTKATAYQNSLQIKNLKYPSNDKTTSKVSIKKEGNIKFCYLNIDSRNIKVAKYNTRQGRLIKRLWDYFGLATSTNEIINIIQEPKDQKNGLLTDDYNEWQKIEKIKTTIKEIQRTLKRNGLNKRFSFHVKGRKVWVENKKTKK